MPAMTNAAKSPEPSANPNLDSGGTRSASGYELCREERIKENLQRMQSLGILNLSLKLKSETRPAKKPFGSPNSGRKSIRDTPPLQPSGPTRRSSRLQNVTPVSYSEAVEAKRGKALEGKIVQLEEGTRPEVYTEEHERLLGNTERSWTCFVDGYGKDGKRIYDPVNGKTCHQCRQKTLGYRTQCSQCNLVQGQFCGDCLYMRYGEHVFEALENPDWICPACRGICNCSLCRTQKGWLPTGAIYRRISQLGYKSVAHYLIQTKRSQTSTEKETDATPNQMSAKRSLSFQAEAQDQEHSLPKSAVDLPESEKLQEKDNKNDDHQADVTTVGDSFQKDNPSDLPEMPKPEDMDNHHVDGKRNDDSLQKEEDDKADINLSSARRSLSFVPSGDKQASVVDVEVQGDLKPSENFSAEEVGTMQISGEKEKKESSGASESCSERTRKRRVSFEPNPNSIGGRLRQRRRSQSGIANEEIA